MLNMAKIPKTKELFKRFNPERVRQILAMHGKWFYVAATIALFVLVVFKFSLYVLNPSRNMDLPNEFVINEKGRAIAPEKVKKKNTEESKIISLNWTDDNNNENLIIQTNEKTYYGFNQADIYFSITNISRRSQVANINFLFRDKSVKLLSLESLNSREELNLEKPKLNNNLVYLEADKLKRKEVRDYVAQKEASDKIKSGKTNYYLAKISYQPFAKGEFYIEAFGEKGGYGHLDPWYNSSWTYRRAITFTENSGNTLTDYQASTTIDTAAIIAEGKMASTCADIRFTDSDGSTLLNYWLESGCDSSSTIIWIKIPQLATSSAKDIYMYYGNELAESISSSSATFYLYDDFTGNTLNDYNWTHCDGSSGSESYDAVNDWIEIRTADNVAECTSRSIPLPKSGYTKYKIIRRAQYPNGVINELSIRQDGSNYYKFILNSSGYSNQGVYKIINGSTVNSSVETGTINNNNQEYIIEMWWDYNSLRLDIDGTTRKNLTTTNTTELTPTSLYFRFFQFNVDWEYFEIRNYISPEPTAGSLGPEETDSAEFISIIDPDNASDTDYTSLFDWENAIEADLSVGTTKVFSYSTASGTIPDGSTVVGATSGAVATSTHMTASTTSSQIMLINIASSTFQSGETVYIKEQATSSTYVVLSNAGNWIIATAKCRSSSGSADVKAVIVDGWITAYSNYVKIYTDTSENYRHNGTYSVSAYRIATTSPITINESYVRIEGLQIYQDDDTATKNAIEITTEDTESDIRIYKNIIKGTGSFTTNSHIGIKASSSAKIYNNIIHGFNFSNSAGLYLAGNNFNYYVYNNTLINSNTGITRIGSSTVVAKNNLTQNCSTGFLGTYDSASDYNLSLDNSAPGSNSATSASVTFLASTSDDFHLHYDDTGARNNGTSLKSDSSLAFSDDIDSQTRYYFWDIGADKYYGTNTAPMITEASSTSDFLILGQSITFSADWTDADSETVKLYVCKNDSISTTTPGCDTDQAYCTDSYNWDSLNDPITCSYTTQASEEGENYYYIFVCDDQASCSTSTSGTFDVTATIIWDGSVSTNWDTATNWDANLTPTANHDAVINGSYSSAPTLSLSAGSATIRSLNIGSTSASTLTISNGDMSTKKLIISGNMTIGANGILTHAANTTAQTHVINLEANNLTIQSGGSINVEAKGYSVNNGLGGGSGGFHASGAGYGGEGGDSLDYDGGICYGSTTMPTDLGSGGGNTSSGGYGGGVVKLSISGATIINGIINSDGEDDSGDHGAGGSGGSILIITDVLEGAGTTTASGGKGYGSTESGSGGGRIAVYYTTDNSSITYESYGGKNGVSVNRMGGAGTIYKKASSQAHGDLIIDNDDQDYEDDADIGKTYINEAITFDTITIQNDGHLKTSTSTNIVYSTFNWDSEANITDNGGILSPFSNSGSLTIATTSRLYEKVIRAFTDLTVNGTMILYNYSTSSAGKLDISGDVIIGSSGNLTHSANTTAQTHVINLEANNLTIQSGGSINVEAK
ncbi:hypothetical protein DRQ25_13905, partial [Candidatus Fermentibacteria bacterium]